MLTIVCAKAHCLAEEKVQGRAMSAMPPCRADSPAAAARGIAVAVLLAAVFWGGIWLILS